MHDLNLANLVVPLPYILSHWATLRNATKEKSPKIKSASAKKKQGGGDNNSADVQQGDQRKCALCLHEKH